MKISSIFTSTLLLCSLLISTHVSAACNQKDVPVGSYQETCSSCKINGKNLTATCDYTLPPLGITSSTKESTLKNYKGCKDSISNCGGKLHCGKCS